MKVETDIANISESPIRSDWICIMSVEVLGTDVIVFIDALELRQVDR